MTGSYLQLTQEVSEMCRGRGGGRHRPREMKEEKGGVKEEGKGEGVKCGLVRGVYAWRRSVLDKVNKVHWRGAATEEEWVRREGGKEEEVEEQSGTEERKEAERVRSDRRDELQTWRYSLLMDTKSSLLLLPSPSLPDPPPFRV
jgi:hypothetical protein